MKVQMIGGVSADPFIAANQRAQQEERLREALEWLEASNAILRGHFRFGKGEQERHGDLYVNPRRLFGKPYASKWLTEGLRNAIPIDVRNSIEAVAGPASCGIIVARDLADFITTDRPLISSRNEPAGEVEAVFLYKDWDRVYGLHPSDVERVSGKKVLLVDDVLHRGHTFAACIGAIRHAGGDVVATAELINRQGRHCGYGVLRRCGNRKSGGA
jgi:orotate phosphoribosyltransferase